MFILLLQYLLYVCPIQSLSQEQLKDYSLQKASLKKEEEDSSDDSDSEDDNDDDSSADSKDGNSENMQVSKVVYSTAGLSDFSIPTVNNFIQYGNTLSSVSVNHIKFVSGTAQ